MKKEENGKDQRISILKSLLDNQYEIFRIGIDAHIKSWQDGDNFDFANLLLLPNDHILRSKIEKWLV